MVRVLLFLALAVLCGCGHHAAEECAPVVATVDGGTDDLVGGDGGTLEKACLALCGYTSCEVFDETKLLCQPGCP